MTFSISTVFTCVFLFFASNVVLAAQHHNMTHDNQAYHCPMHPEVVGGKDDSCPKCGMNLQLSQSADYQCPMHPEVVGGKDDSCPKCGMNLEKPSKSNQHSMHHH